MHLDVIAMAVGGGGLLFGFHTFLNRLSEKNLAPHQGSVPQWEACGADHPLADYPTTYYVTIRRGKAYMVIGSVDLAEADWEDALQSLASEAEDKANTLNAIESTTLTYRRIS